MARNPARICSLDWTTSNLTRAGDVPGTLETIMEYTIWTVPVLCEDPIELTIHSNGDGRRAAQECLSAAAAVWEGLAAAGAAMLNAHPTTGQTAEEFRAVGRQYR